MVFFSYYGQHNLSAGPGWALSQALCLSPVTPKAPVRQFPGPLVQAHCFCYNSIMEYMDKCRHHPERDACVLCQKMEVAYCQECLDNCKACTDPCLYCKFRPGCVIWELCRKEARKRCKEEAEAH